jgi:hypothetical protein
VKRNRLFLDTNILEPLATLPLSASLPKIRKYLSANFVVMISPLTVDELLLGINGGDERFFVKDQEKLRVLHGVGRLRLLPSPAKFAIKSVLGIDTNPSTPSENVIKHTIDAVLRANSRSQLEQGLVPLRYTKKRTGGVTFESIEQRHNQGKSDHAQILNQLRQKQLRRPTPVEWVKKSFRHFDLNVNDVAWCRLASALEAGIHLNSFLCDQAEQQQYDFSNHDSDWIDVHQLFYLSDPSIHFLTRDAKLRKRISQCGQASRIVLFEDLLLSIGL